MQIIFESRDPQGAKLRDLAERRIRFAIRRLSWLVPRAKVRLTDVNGPRGGIDKHCQIQLETATFGKVVISSVARDWTVAFENGLARASRLLIRSLRRNRETQRKQMQHLLPPAENAGAE